MSRRGSAAAALVCVVACSRGSADARAKASADASAAANASASAAASASASAAANANADASAEERADASAAGGGAGSGRDEGEAAFAGAPRSVKSIGHTSVVFKIALPSGRKAAFKPASKRGPVRYKGEIAARRLGLALGIGGSVPAAFLRTFASSAFVSAPGGDELVVHAGVVKGALVPWIDGLQFLELQRAPLSGQWKEWLGAGATIPGDKRALARQISTLVAFDFVTANWDRWSGGNVGVDPATGALLYIDNDGAFFEVPPRDALARNKKLLEGVDRFSRSFVDRVRALDDEALARAIGEESPGVPLLSAKALAGVAARRKELLAIVAAKTKTAGDAETFTFP